jgi:hypothetical protein
MKVALSKHRMTAEVVAAALNSVTETEESRWLHYRLGRIGGVCRAAWIIDFRDSKWKFASRSQ